LGTYRVVHGDSGQNPLGIAGKPGEFPPLFPLFPHKWGNTGKIEKVNEL